VYRLTGKGTYIGHVPRWVLSSEEGTSRQPLHIFTPYRLQWSKFKGILEHTKKKVDAVSDLLWGFDSKQWTHTAADLACAAQLASSNFHTRRQFIIWNNLGAQEHMNQRGFSLTLPTQLCNTKTCPFWASIAGILLPFSHWLSKASRVSLLVTSNTV